jgi:cell division protein FtsW
MENLLKKYLKGDPTLWVVFIFLCILSIVEMYSASSTLAYKASNHALPVIRHVGFLAGGALLAFVVHLIPSRYIRIFSYVGLLLSVLLLIFVQFKGHNINDAARWLVIGGVQFQPSELGKLSVIIVVADLISRIKDSKIDEWFYFRNIMIILIVVTALILLENLSTAVLLFAVVFIMMFIGRISWKYLISTILFASVVIFIGIAMVKTIPQNSMPKMFKRVYTWENRFERHFDKKESTEKKYVINDQNRQVQHGKIAIARGGIFGVMPGNSVERDYLPQAYSDFIFAIIIEEMGLVGGVFVIILYLILLFRAGRIATTCSSVFPALLVIGLSLMIVIQTWINMAVTSTLLPVTGQPLPLISRGGTSILITCIYFGIIFGITREMKEEQSLNENNSVEQEELPTVNLEEIK